jgi:hypothetical protein
MCRSGACGTDEIDDSVGELGLGGSGAVGELGLGGSGAAAELALGGSCAVAELACYRCASGGHGARRNETKSPPWRSGYAD